MKLKVHHYNTGCDNCQMVIEEKQKETVKKILHMIKQHVGCKNQKHVYYKEGWETCIDTMIFDIEKDYEIS